MRRRNKGKLSYAYGTPTVQIPAEALNQLLKLERHRRALQEQPAGR